MGENNIHYQYFRLNQERCLSVSMVVLMAEVIKRNNVRVTGTGERTLLFAHGFGCDQHVWRHLLRAFEKEFTLVVFDFVGAGGSDLTAYTSNRYNRLDGYARDVLDIIEELNLKEVTFIGHSVSCMTGLRAAIAKPEYFKELVFVCPSPCYINEIGYHGGLNREDLDGLFEMMESNYLGWSASMAPMIMGNAERPELGEELTTNFCSTHPKIALEFARVTFFSDNRADLKQLRKPSLTLQCREDMLAPLEIGEYIKANTPNNRLVVLQATGHCPHLSAPEETIAAIRSFIN